MDDVHEWYNHKLLDRASDSLRSNGFDVSAFDSVDVAVSKVLDLVDSGSEVGLGGSKTLRELGIPDSLRDKGFTVFDHWKAGDEGASDEEILEIRREHLTSDVFISSSNAITETGELVNIDGIGQRVAAMIFGPKKVIIVAGVNKIVEDVDEAKKRVKNVATPMNAKRLGLKPPCTEKGKCLDCKSESRICNITSVIHRQPPETKTHIILLNKRLGY